MPEQAETILYRPSIEANKQKIQHLHDISSLVLGIGCGILTLESIYGFIFYLVGFTVINGIFYTICCEGNPKKFFYKPVQEIFFDGIFHNLSGFIMMWCLIYALVKTSS